MLLPLLLLLPLPLLLLVEVGPLVVGVVVSLLPLLPLLLLLLVLLLLLLQLLDGWSLPRANSEALGTLRPHLWKLGPVGQENI